jgi:prevent-host-death family protein
VRTVSKSALKAKLLEYFRDVEQTGEPLVVTSHGVPVLEIVPYREGRPTAEVFGDLRGKVRYPGDIVAPTEDEWDVV